MRSLCILEHRRRGRRNEQRRRDVDTQHLPSIYQRLQLSDAELVAKAPGFPEPGYQMEMERRLRDAITGLTTETAGAPQVFGTDRRLLLWITIVLVSSLPHYPNNITAAPRSRPARPPS